MRHVVDARGLACPLPVVNTREEMARMQPGETVEVRVDNEIAVQNLEKFARIRHHRIESEKRAEGEYCVRITKGGETQTQEAQMQAAPAEPRRSAEGSGTLVALSSSAMGQGEEELGRTLMKAFIFALTRQEQPPETVLLYNSGAFLSCEGSDSVGDLRALEAQGTQVLTCGTCLNYYGLTEKLAVGGVTNMYDIVEGMEKASKIIRP